MNSLCNQCTLTDVLCLLLRTITPFQVLADIASKYVLVSVVDNDFAHGDALKALGF